MSAIERFRHLTRLIAHSDRLGYLYCTDCRKEVKDGIPVYADSFPHNEDNCDSCGKAVDEAAP